MKEHGFVNAGELYIGDKLLDSNGSTLIVEDRKVEITDKPVKVYNFQVEDFHTYHVGENYVLVHNAGDYGQRYTPEQQEVVKQGKNISKRGQTTQTEAENYIKQCREVGIGPDKARIDAGHMDRMNPNMPAAGVSGQPHLHVPSGKKNSHIPIIGD